MGIEPTSPAWKAGTLPLSYSRERRAAPTISKALRKTQVLAPARCDGLTGLRSARETLLVQEDPADRNRRSGAVQVGHQRTADLRVRGKLA